MRDFAGTTDLTETGSSADDVVIRLRNLVKRFDSRTVFRGVNLDVE